MSIKNCQESWPTDWCNIHIILSIINSINGLYTLQSKIPCALARGNLKSLPNAVDLQVNHRLGQGKLIHGITIFIFPISLVDEAG